MKISRMWPGLFVVTSLLKVSCLPWERTDPAVVDASTPTGDAVQSSDVPPAYDVGVSPDGGDASGAIDIGADVQVTPNGDVPNTGQTDVGRDVVEAGSVLEGPACEMAPHMASSRLVLEGLTAARDFVFDGHGGVAVAQGSTVVLRRGGDRSPLTMAMGGEVVALRFTRNSGLVLAVFNNTGSGTSNGAIYQVAPGATTASLRLPGLRQPGGLAIDAADRIWFSDTTMNTVYRLPADAAAGTGAQMMVTDVPSPTQLLIDAEGRYLFVVRSDTNTVMRVAMASSDGGTVGPAMPFVGGFSRVSGLAQDECDNVFVADEIVDRIWRVPILAGDAVRVVMDVRGPRSLMFGVGDPFGARELYALSTDGTLRAANLIARGVPLAVPTR